MRDPFPIPPIPALSKAVQPWADYLSLPTLPLHVHEIILIALFYQFVATIASPALSRRLFPSQYNSLSRSKRLSWDVHVVSLVQSTLINSLALWVMYADDERRNMDGQERVYGYDGGAAMIQGLATGYFLWDLIMTAANVDIFGVGMLAHAISALLVYSFGFRPFMNFYSCNFILWELSSPFLNIHWFFDKLGMTGSTAQLINGVMLIFTFFSCRLVYGTYQSYTVFRDVWTGFHNKPSYIPSIADAAQNSTVPAQYQSTMLFVTESSSVPLWLIIIYLGANVTLNSLNFYWFFKMIEALRKRFEPKEEKAEIEASKDAGVATGVEEKVELKIRPRRRTLLDGELEGDEPPPAI